MAATERGLLSPAMAMAATDAATVAMAAMAVAMAATGVSYHRIRRSELSQKQNHKNNYCRSCENLKKERNILA